MADHLVRFIETYRGSSFPTLAELTSGKPAVVKLRGAGNGAEALLAEFIVNRLAHIAGLPVPNACVVHVAEGFPWNYGTDEFHDLVMKSAGPNLALDVIPVARPLPLERYTELPAFLVSQVVTLDRVFSNWDRADLSTNIVYSESNAVWFVDHGSCRFLQQKEAHTFPPLPNNHSFAEQGHAFDMEWLEAIDTDAVSEVVREIPSEWLSETHLSREAVALAIESRLALARQPPR